MVWKHKTRRTALAAAVAMAAGLTTAVLPAGAAQNVAAVMVADIAPGTGGSAPAVVTNVGGTAFFPATNGTSGVELFKSDGTAGGTVMVKDINLAAGSTPNNLTNVGGTLFFTASDGITGIELWKSDGTTVGTVQVADINRGTNSSSPGNLTVFNGALYFSASDGSASPGVNGTELWKSDGTAAGTVLVKDINPGAFGASSSPANFMVLGGALFFSASDGTNGVELWSSDGTTAGTALFKDINPAGGTSTPANMRVHGSNLFFSATNGTSGRELFMTDGTPAGTGLVKDVFPGASGGVGNVGDLTVSGGTLFFLANDGVVGTELWKSDGTEAGTVLVKDINPGTALEGSFATNLTDVNGTLFLNASSSTNSYGAELWKSDGTEAGTVIVKDIAPSGGSTPNFLVNVGGTLFFQANDGTSGAELWSSDGTVVGTVMVADINPGASNSSPTGLTNVNGTLFFNATVPAYGAELWRTILNNSPVAADDSYTSEATSALTVAAPGVLGNDTDADGDTLTAGSASDPANGTVTLNANGSFTYTPDTGFTGPDTFTYQASDGKGGSDTATVTIAPPPPPNDAALIKDINPGPGGSTPSRFYDNGDSVLFLSCDGYHDSLPFGCRSGKGLWKTDGTDAGTVRVKDISPTDVGQGFIPAAGTLFFVANDGVFGYELWKTDGTEAGTVMVKDIRPGAEQGVARVGLTAFGGALYFQADDGVAGSELWKSDGTAAGTVMVTDLMPGAGGSGAEVAAVMGDVMLLVVDDGVHGYELWKSNGTAAGTMMVKDINPAGNSSPERLHVLGSTAFFVANDDATGRELWKTDGTAAGTAMVKDVIPGPSGGLAGNTAFATAGDMVVFTANDGVAGQELWKTDGTTAGTVLVKDINPGPDTFDEFPRLTRFGGSVLFRANDGSHGVELWKSDATAAGTVMVKDIEAGPASSYAYLGAVVGDVAYLGAATTATGFELWKTDGTGAGTVLVEDINPGSAGSGTFTVTQDAYDMVTIRDEVYFTANDGTNGGELWRLFFNPAAVNEAPVANDDTATTAEDVAVTVNAPGVLGNDSDATGDVLTAGSASDPAKGTVVLNADGSYTYTPHANYFGSDNFTYVADDGKGGTDTATVTITVTSVNDVPVAGEDAYTTAAGTPLTVAAPGVVGNDTDVDGDPLTAGTASTPANGTVTLNGNGSFSYTPVAGFAGTDTFTYTASDGRGGSATATVTITVTAAQPGGSGPTELTVADLAVAEGNSGTTAATFTVTRTGATTGASTVKYKTSGGTAAAGADYTGPVPLTVLNFEAFETTKTVAVDVSGDTVPEKDETFNLVLSAPTGAAIADATGVATIRNDDGSAYLAVDSVTVNEGSSATFTITRSGNTDGTSTASYRTSGGTATAGTDYTPVNLTPVSFGTGATTVTVTVPVADDASAENNETFNLVLSGPSAGTVLSDASGTATIVDDEGPLTPGPATFLSVNDLSMIEGQSGTTTAAFTVSRSGNITGASSVKVRTNGGTATAGTDYTAVGLTVVSFAANQATQTVTVDVAGDTAPENNETLNLVLSAPTGATIADASGTATVVNDDGAAYLSVGNVSVTEGNAGTTAATFTITRTGNTDGASTVSYQTSGGTATAGTDYTAVALTTVTFAAGQTTKTVTVDVTGDTTTENNETFNLVLTATAAGTVISDASGTATIVNDD